MAQPDTAAGRSGATKAYDRAESNRGEDEPASTSTRALGASGVDASARSFGGKRRCNLERRQRAAHRAAAARRCNSGRATRCRVSRNRGLLCGSGGGRGAARATEKRLLREATALPRRKAARLLG